MAEIRPITIDNLMDHYAPNHRFAFYSSPPLDLSDYEKQRFLYEDATVLGMFEDDKSVATVVSLPMTQNVRGKILPMGGVAGVTSNPMYRRQGYVKQLMYRLLNDLNNAGIAVSTLYPFRESFYERLGYILFHHIKAVKFKTADMKPLLNLDLSGSVEFINQKDGWEQAREMLHEMQAERHGMGLFSPEPLKHLYGHDDLWLAIARDNNDEIIGTMSYKITAFWGTFEVARFFAKNSHARYLMLQFIAKHVDQVHDVHIKRLQGTENPETWFSDLSMKTDPDIWLTPMGRIININGLSGIEVGKETITIQVEDDFCEWNNGIYTLDGRSGYLVITQGSEPDCTLNIKALSALVYGTHDPHDFQWRGWGKPSVDVIQKLLTLFPPIKPYLLALF